MPYTIHTAKAKIKDSLGNFRSIDVFSNEIEDTQQAAIQAVNNAKITAINVIDDRANAKISPDVTNDEVEAMLAPIFDTATAYTAGTYVRNADGSTNKLYRLTSDHAAGAAWADTSKVEVKIGSQITDLKSAISETDFDIAPYTGKLVITDTHKNKYVKNSDGTLANYNNWVASDFIKCEPGMALNIPSRVGNYNAYYTDDNEDSFLSSLSAGNNIVPADAKYFRVSSTKAVYDQYGFGVTTNRTGFDDIAITVTNDPLNSAAKWSAFSSDANNLGVNKVYEIMYNTNIVNLPTNDFLGTILTFDYSVNASAPTTIQMAFARYGKAYRRMRWGANWGDWYEFANKNDIPETVNNTTAYKGLGDFIACGDSNTVSLSYPTSSAGIPVKSWATSLAQMIGSNCTIYAAGGRSTAGFIASSDYAPAIADTAQFAILYLGINDCSQSVEIETFTTNYTQIVNDLLTNHKFVFCLNIPETVQPSSRRTQYNTAIENVCSSIAKAFLVDITGCSDRIAVYKNVGHLSSIGYAVLAGEIAQAINKTMSENDYFDAQIDTDSAT